MSSQDTLEQPPLKKQKLETSASTQSQDADKMFKLSQPLLSSLESNNSTIHPCKIVIKKGDKIERRVSQLLRSISEKKEPTLVMASGNAIQKLVSIVEIVKTRLAENDSKGKFEQFNKLDSFDTVIKKNELIDKTVRTSVFYALLRLKTEDNVGPELKHWTRQTI